jgi:hypothetical protein
VDRTRKCSASAMRAGLEHRVGRAVYAFDVHHTFCICVFNHDPFTSIYLLHTRFSTTRRLISIPTAYRSRPPGTLPQAQMNISVAMGQGRGQGQGPLLLLKKRVLTSDGTFPSVRIWRAPPNFPNGRLLHFMHDCTSKQAP